MPAGMVTRWEPSPDFTCSLNLVSFSCVSLPSSSPNRTKSTEVLTFLSFLARVVRVFSESLVGEQTKATIRCRWVLFCRCLSASCCSLWLVHPPREHHCSWSGVQLGSTYTCDLNTRCQVGLPTDLLLRPVQTLEDAALLRGQCAEHLWALATHAHKTDRGLRVARRDGLEEDVDGVPLRTESVRSIVSIATAFAVVDNDHDRFENHLDWVSGERSPPRSGYG